jgi:spermidine/putrescine transport system permease protein
MVKKIFSNIYTLLIFIFLYAPIAVLIIFSFNAGRTTGLWEGFTFQWYQALLEDRQIMRALYYTVTIAILSSVTATIIGTFAAVGINNMSSKRKWLMLNINNLPILNPDIITGVALMLLYISLNFKFGYLTMLLAHITFNIPYVILSVLPKLKQLDDNLLEAAMDLGASPMVAFQKVIIPQIMPGIITGLLIAFTLSIDDFVISFFTTGSGVTNLSIVIFSMARRGINPKINALSAIMFTVVLTLLIIVNLRTSNNNQMKEV